MCRKNTHNHLRRLPAKALLHGVLITSITLTGDFFSCNTCKFFQPFFPGTGKVVCRRKIEKYGRLRTKEDVHELGKTSKGRKNAKAKRKESALSFWSFGLSRRTKESQITWLLTSVRPVVHYITRDAAANDVPIFLALIKTSGGPRGGGHFIYFRGGVRFYLRPRDLLLCGMKQTDMRRSFMRPGC